jgi:hypothetical protein
MIFCSVLLTCASPSRAQTILPGIPSSPIHTGTGANIAADWADPQDLDGHAWGITAGTGLSRLGVAGGAGEFAEETSFGGGAAFRLFGGGVIPVDVTAQFTGWSVGGDERVTAVMPALGARASVVAVPVKPWGLVYYQIADNAADEVRTTIGADSDLFFGIGAHAGYDLGESGNSWGLGLHVKIGVPVPDPVPFGNVVRNRAEG